MMGKDCGIKETDFFRITVNADETIRITAHCLARKFGEQCL